MFSSYRMSLLYWQYIYSFTHTLPTGFLRLSRIWHGKCNAKTHRCGQKVQQGDGDRDVLYDPTLKAILRRKSYLYTTSVCRSYAINHPSHPIPSNYIPSTTSYQARGNALNSFEPFSLNYTTFAAALAKTFNLQFTPKELGYLVTLYDPQKSQEVVCKPFLTAFFALGSTARDTVRQSQLAKQVSRTTRLVNVPY